MAVFQVSNSENAQGKIQSFSSTEKTHLVLVERGHTKCLESIAVVDSDVLFDT